MKWFDSLVQDAVMGLMFVGAMIWLYVFVIIKLIARRRAKKKAKLAAKKLKKNPTPEPVYPIPGASAGSPAPFANPASGQSTSPMFISYRREDSADITGRIYDSLAHRYGRSSIFKDVDNIPLGIDFRSHLQESVGKSGILLAVIGKNWFTWGEGEEPRVYDTRDYLRIEIESALQRNIPVIPILVQGAEMPNEVHLPESLQALAFRNGISVRPDPDFHSDMERLARGIDAVSLPPVPDTGPGTKRGLLRRVLGRKGK